MGSGSKMKNDKSLEIWRFSFGTGGGVLRKHKEVMDLTVHHQEMSIGVGKRDSVKARGLEMF